MSDVGQVGVLCVAGPITYGGAVCIVLYCSLPSTVRTTYSLFCSPLCCFVAQGRLKAVEPAKEQQGEKKQTRWVM